MTICISAVAAMVAVAAAIRSTWSPCGLSMLSTITPLSERARGHSYRATTTWFVVGATVGGLTIGVVMALLAGGAGALRLSSATLGSVAIGAALVAFGSVQQFDRRAGAQYRKALVVLPALAGRRLG